MPAGTRSDNEEKAAPKSAYDPSKVRGDDDNDPPIRSAKVAGDPGVITVPDKVFALSPDGGMAAFSADGGESIQVYDTYTESLVKSVTNSFSSQPPSSSQKTVSDCWSEDVTGT